MRVQAHSISPPNLAAAIAQQPSSSTPPTLKLTPPQLPPPAGAAPSVPKHAAQPDTSPLMAAAPAAPAQPQHPAAQVDQDPPDPPLEAFDVQPSGQGGSWHPFGTGQASSAGAAAPIAQSVPQAPRHGTGEPPAQERHLQAPHPCASAPARLPDALAHRQAHVPTPHVSTDEHPVALFALVLAMWCVHQSARPVSALPVAAASARRVETHICTAPWTVSHDLPFCCAAAGHIRAAALRLSAAVSTALAPSTTTPANGRGGVGSVEAPAASSRDGRGSGIGARLPPSSAEVAEEVANVLAPLARLLQDPPESTAAALDTLAACLDLEADAHPANGTVGLQGPPRANGSVGGMHHSGVSPMSRHSGGSVEAQGVAVVSDAMRAIAFCALQPKACRLLKQWLREIMGGSQAASTGCDTGPLDSGGGGVGMPHLPGFAQVCSSCYRVV